MKQLYYIAASPLVKIFLPEWTERLEQDPDLIYDKETPFEFDVDTGSRSIKVAFNKPQSPPGAKYDDQVNIFNYLTGGLTGANSRATDCYGIVHFNPDVDMISAMDQMATMNELIMSEDPKVQAEVLRRRQLEQKNIIAKIKATRAQVLKRSEERIMRHAKMNYNNLIKQWQTNEESNLGKYPPSFSELMASYALRDNIQVAENKNAKIKAKMNQMMQNPVV